MFDRFAQARRRALEVLRQVAEYAEEDGRPQFAGSLRRLEQDLGTLRYNIAIVGHMKRGKSTLINALLGRQNDDIAPVQARICTSAIIHYIDRKATGADRELAKVKMGDEPPVEISVTAIRDYITEERNPENRKNVRGVEVYGDFPLLNEAVSLVDTPGKGSIHTAHDTLLLDFLPHADAIIFPIACDLPIEAREKEFLSQLSTQEKDRIFFVLTKRDEVEDSEIGEVLGWVRQQITEVCLPPGRIHETSAKLLFDAYLRRADPAEIGRIRDASGVAELERDLEEHILRHSEKNSLIMRRLNQILGTSCTFCETSLVAVDNDLSRFRDDAVALEGEAKQLQDDAAKLRKKSKRALIKFRRDWDHCVTRFKSDMMARSARIADRLADRFDEAGLITAVTRSFRLTREVAREVQASTEAGVGELTERLDNAVFKLNEDLEQEVNTYVRRTQPGQIVSAAVGAGALGTMAAAGVGATTTIGTAVSGISSAWAAIPVVQTGAATATANVGAVQAVWAWLFGAQATGATATQAAALVAQQAAWTAAVSTTVAGIISSSFALIALMVVKWIVTKGVAAISKGRLPELVDAAFTAGLDDLEKRLGKERDRIASHYEADIEELIRSTEDRLATVQEAIANQDPVVKLTLEEKRIALQSFVDQLTTLKSDVLMLT